MDREPPEPKRPRITSSPDIPAVKYPLEMHHCDPRNAALYEESLSNRDQFWNDLAKRRIRWMRDFDKVREVDMNTGSIKWFLGGQLNVSDNCVDRHVEMYPDRIALIWEKDEPKQHENITYRQLKDQVCKVANAFKAQGIKKGDRVVIYMPMIPLAVSVMLACTRIGAVHSIVFAGFSSEALSSRINDAQAETVITADEGIRGGKIIPLKQTVDKAVNDCPCVKRVLVATRTGTNVPMTPNRDYKLEELIETQSTQCTPEPLDSEDPLFMLYTSGSTGKPKGILHTQAGYLLYTGLTHQLVFDYKEGDVYACVADIGWITGHSYVVYGPLCNGATTVLFESTPVYPDYGRYWEMVERLRLTQIYTAPTALRLLLKASNEFVTKYDRSSLRILGCVGEPLNDKAWLWYNDIVGEGRCTVVDTWWQTETGGIMITPRPSPDNSTPKPGFPMRPFFGIEPVLLDDQGKVIEGNDVSGNLCIGSPWPSMARTIYGNHEKFLDTYYRPYKGYYFTGDGAYRDGNGYYQITGRVDDVINVKGHRLGTAELESAMNRDPRVAETAVVGYPHEIFGQAILAFIIVKDGVSENEDVLFGDLKNIVKTAIGSFAIPHHLMLVPGLPKTRSGKIMRRILRKIANNLYEELGDVSTLANPPIVQDIMSKWLQVASATVTNNNNHTEQ